MPGSTEPHPSETSLHVSFSSGSSSASSDSLIPEEYICLLDGNPGYFPVRLGQRLENGRYCILRKLGWGNYSSVWLARDRTEERFVSLKILNREATEELENGKSDELGLLRTITESDPSHRGYKHSLLLYDSFKLTSYYGEHQCIVTEALGSSIAHFAHTNDYGKTQQPIIVRKITRQILLCLEYLHQCHIIHADIKPENILYRLKSLDALVAHQLADRPSTISHYDTRKPPPKVPVVWSQPLPFTIDIVRSDKLEVVLADVGRSHRRSQHFHEDIQPLALRAPEVILGYRWDTPVDIWNLGCITAELLSQRWLFKPAETADWSYDEDHLARMTEVLEANFETEFLNKCQKKFEFFKEDGTFAHFTKHESPSWTVKKVLSEFSILNNEAERDIAERFILRCLQLIPENRPTATELLDDPWFQGFSDGQVKAEIATSD